MPGINVGVAKIVILPFVWAIAIETIVGLISQKQSTVHVCCVSMYTIDTTGA
jgi:hypothetical protein